MVEIWPVVLAIVSLFALIIGCYLFVFGVWKAGVKRMDEHNRDEAAKQRELYTRIEQVENRLSAEQTDTRRELADKIDTLIAEVGRLGGRIDDGRA